jgi:hypothetical protein
MNHLDDEAVTQAGVRERALLSAAERAHLDSCARCRSRVEDTARLAAALREAEPAEPAVPSFDALVSPHLAPRPEPVPVPGLSPGRAWRLALAVTLRQAALVPRPLWPVTVGGFAALAVAVFLAPAAGLTVSAFLGPVTIALVTVGAVGVCDPAREPRQESMHTMLVPPVAVWLARFTLVLGLLLLMAVAVSALASVLPGGGGGVGSVVGSWLSPALLGAGVTTFGAVWRSPATGLAFGAVSWAVAVAIVRGGLLGTTVGAAVAPLWTDLWVSLTIAALALAAASWLVARPESHLRGG